VAPKEKEDALGMVAPPSGTVTFLFTDIEGSSRMWEKCPKTMRTALARQDEVLRSAIEANGGHVFTEKLAAYRTAEALRILLTSNMKPSDRPSFLRTLARHSRESENPLLETYSAPA